LTHEFPGRAQNVSRGKDGGSRAAGGSDLHPELSKKQLKRLFRLRSVRALLGGKVAHSAPDLPTPPPKVSSVDVTVPLGAVFEALPGQDPYLAGLSATVERLVHDGASRLGPAARISARIPLAPDVSRSRSASANASGTQPAEPAAPSVVPGPGSDIGKVVERWRVLHELISGHPVLRLYLATSAPLGTLHQPGGPLAASLVISTVPYPPHPRHGGDVYVVPLSTLLKGHGGKAEIGELGRSIVEHAVKGRPNRHVSELEYATERFLRPLIRAARILDEYGIIIDLASDGTGIEMDASGTPTGRIVLSPDNPLHVVSELGKAGNTVRLGRERRRQLGGACVTDCASASKVAAARLMSTILGMARSLEMILSDRYSQGGRSINASVKQFVRRVIREELRYLRPETVEWLGTIKHPVASYLHSVTPEQQQILNAILVKGREIRSKQNNGTLSADPAYQEIDLSGAADASWYVMFDLDGSAMDTSERMRSAIAKTAAALGIPALERAAEKDLPTHEVASVRAWWDAHGLEAAVGGKVSFEEVHRRLHAEFIEGDLTTDRLAPGMNEFIGALWRVGVRSLFVSGRAERRREGTLAAFRASGHAQPELILMPDLRSGSIEDGKVARLREHTGGRVLAWFEDKAENARALSEAFPWAMGVHVHQHRVVADPRFASFMKDRNIRTFEMDPSQPDLHQSQGGFRYEGGRVTPLPTNRVIGDFRFSMVPDHTMLDDWSITISPTDAAELLARMSTHEQQQVFAIARKLRGSLGQAGEPDIAQTARLVHSLLTHDYVRKGPREQWPWETQSPGAGGSTPVARAQLIPPIEDQRAIVVDLPSFSVKAGWNGLKAEGFRPGLGEARALALFRAIDLAVREVFGYRPGLQFRILEDGYHLRSVFGRPNAAIDGYHGALRQLVELVGGQDSVRIIGYPQMAEQTRGKGYAAERNRTQEALRQEFREAFAEVDITRDPHGELAKADQLSPTRRDPALSVSEAFKSILTNVPTPRPPRGVSLTRWRKLLFEDLFNVWAGEPRVLQGRRRLLRDAFEKSWNYVAAQVADKRHGFPAADGDIRATVNAKNGQCGLGLTSCKKVAPWHATAYVDGDTVGADSATALRARAFVPVYIASSEAPAGQPSYSMQDPARRGKRQPFFFVVPQLVAEGSLLDVLWRAHATSTVERDQNR
jgi:hypothetical protein